MTTTKRASLFGSKAATTVIDTPAIQQADLSAGLQDAAPARQPYPKASTRVGRRSITVYVEPETLKQLRRLKEADEDLGKETSLQDLMLEAINHLFAARGVSRLA